MLVRMLPDQVVDNWEFLSYAIEEALPPFADAAGDRMSSILTALLSDKMVCWVSVNSQNTIDNVVTTSITEDDCSGMKNLVIYSVFGVGETTMNRRSWMEAYKTLSDYAKAQGCYRIVAYTAEQSIIELVKRLGGDASYTFISVPLTNGVR